VIDHASFHHSAYIEKVVATAGCELWYLPPYCPDLNEIEHWYLDKHYSCLRRYPNP